jgi:hypothetical protein
MVAGFLATTNAGRVALAAQACGPGSRGRLAAVLVGCVLITAAALLADALLDALSISPESFRIAAGLVLATTAVRTIIWPQPAPGPLSAVLITPELTSLALTFGADEPTGKVLLAAVPALLLLPLAFRARGSAGGVRAAQFLAALQIVVAVAFGVSGIRDV